MIEIVVYTTLAIIIILLIKDVFFPSEKTKIKNKKKKGKRRIYSKHF